MSSDDEEYAELFVQTWAEAVLRQVVRFREMRTKHAVDGRNFERMEDWSPTQLDLHANFRQLWAEAHTLVWASYQLERWNRQLSLARGETPPAEDAVLKQVRNALEHLEDAQFLNDTATARPGDKRALAKLGGLPVVLADGGPVFELIDPDDLERRAVAVVRSVQDRLDQEAADWFAEFYPEPDTNSEV